MLCLGDKGEIEGSQRSWLSVSEIVPWSTLGGGRINVSFMASKLLKNSKTKGLTQKIA